MIPRHPSDPYTASVRASHLQVLSRMVRVANPSHVKAAQLRESGVEWAAALKKAKVPDTDIARQSVRRFIRENVSTAKAEAQAESDATDAELRAKRKDLKAREAVLKQAEREAILKRCFDRSVKLGCGPCSSGGASSSSSSSSTASSSTASSSNASSSSSSSSGGGGAASSSTSDSAVDLTAAPETMVVKAKLKVARWMLRMANKHKGRVKKQGQGMAIKLKGAREAGQRVVELERAVAGLREDAASARAAAAAAGGREEEFFSMKRDFTKRGAPYDPTFEELIAPAMMASGASGNVIGEILRTCTLLAFRCFYL
jgi:hypothetical protein